MLFVGSMSFISVEVVLCAVYLVTIYAASMSFIVGEVLLCVGCVLISVAYMPSTPIIVDVLLYVVYKKCLV